MKSFSNVFKKKKKDLPQSASIVHATATATVPGTTSTTTINVSTNEHGSSHSFANGSTLAASSNHSSSNTHVPESSSSSSGQPTVLPPLSHDVIAFTPLFPEKTPIGPVTAGLPSRQSTMDPSHPQQQQQQQQQEQQQVYEAPPPSSPMPIHSNSIPGTPTSSGPRSPHTEQSNNINLPHRSNTLPPSYNSLGISPALSSASHVSPSLMQVSPFQSSSVASDFSPATTSASSPSTTATGVGAHPSPLTASPISSSFVSNVNYNNNNNNSHALPQTPQQMPYQPPPTTSSFTMQGMPYSVMQHQQQHPSPASHIAYQNAQYLPAQHLHHHQQQLLQQQQPLGYHPGPAGYPPTQPTYSSVPTGVTQHQYGHRPFVAPGSQNQSYPIIMAIDWGTTYSSMAYAYQQDGEVHEVSTWPKQSHNYPKVPTCNLYGPGSKEILEWGYPAKIAKSKPPNKHHVLLSKYKLHLDDTSGPHPPLPNGLTVVDAIADYLRLFHAHVVQSALKGFGAAFGQHHIQYCLSVPAMWNDHAKAMMRQAALQAGMISAVDPPHRLLLISEPEAAALYCEKKCDQFAIGHGQKFMICDAGGGTVDLIVFEVAVGPHGRSLKEVTRGSGHSCGSIFLDERMETLLRKKFSRWGDKQSLTPANWSNLMETFIHQVKPLFDGIDDQYITMPAVPGRADMTDYDIGLEDGVLTVTAEEMRLEVFDPVVDDVLRLIQHQLQQTNFNCQAIFMVGGFGCSNYLQTRVRAEFGRHVGLIAVPPRAELAVVRGAALAGITPRMVAARVARRWYGVDSLMAYEAGSDMPHKRVQDRDGIARAKDRFSVYVSPGQQVGVDECITKRYVTFQYPNPVNSPLYACSSPEQPRYVDHPSVEKIGEFTIPLPFIQGAQPGHKIMFELRMYFGATEIRAEAEVNGMVVSTRCQFTG
ncbi:Heat shock 70 kDa protein 12A [Podila humilis]|nr:Heat shock 70 kDa protein 12A [Podila humilis]